MNDRGVVHLTVLFAGLFTILQPGSQSARAQSTSVGVESSVAVSSNNISGLWLWSRISPDGTLAKNYFLLKQNGTQLTGKMEFPWGGFSDLTDGTVNGKQVHFTRDGSPPPEYTGKVDGDNLHLVGRENGTATTMELVRLPDGTPMYSPAPAPPAIHVVASNGLARKPPMGWNAWNHFKGNIDDQTVRRVVGGMISSGMRDAGYVYVNIDDEWAGERDANQNMQSNKHFPDMKALADFIHGHGMKMGLYSSPGTETCEGHQGSLGHEEQDARSYASWGTDFLKYDWCSASFVYSKEEMHAVYQKMGDALQRTGRPIVYSLSQYGAAGSPQWGPGVGGNLWRTTLDISDNWQSMYWIWMQQQKILQWNKPGGWNDPDMLEVGNGGMSDEEYRTHFSMWALLSAPLLAGNDPRSMSPATIAILTNREVIAIDQDGLAAPPSKLPHNGGGELWVKPLADGASAVMLLNTTEEALPVALQWETLGVKPPYAVRDLWTHRDVDSASGYVTSLPPHAVRMFRVSATGK